MEKVVGMRFTRPFTVVRPSIPCTLLPIATRINLADPDGRPVSTSVPCPLLSSQPCLHHCNRLKCFLSAVWCAHFSLSFSLALSFPPSLSLYCSPSPSLSLCRSLSLGRRTITLSSTLQDRRGIDLPPRRRLLPPPPLPRLPLRLPPREANALQGQGHALEDEGDPLEDARPARIGGDPR